MNRLGVGWHRDPVDHAASGPSVVFRKRNRNGYYDSLCLKCFWTAAFGTKETTAIDLAEAESSHQCGHGPALLGLPVRVPISSGTGAPATGQADSENVIDSKPCDFS